jgi:lysyl-tRNA synthetase class 2
MEKIEPFLLEQKACFVTHYPIQMGALAAQEPSKPFVERVEAYLNGIEICNGYLELNDAIVLNKRFKTTLLKRATLNRDLLFENAMNFGMPACAGNALGIDRVIAILLGLNNISPLFPIPFLSQFSKGTVAFE